MFWLGPKAAMRWRHRRIGSEVMQRLMLTALLVKDYDEAIAFYAGKLGFEVTQDTRLSAEKRWVVVTPRSGGGSLLLARAADDRQRAAIGEQSGGRVFLFLETDDFARDHADYSAKGVIFAEEPRQEPYGTVAVFIDLYGNHWDLIQPARATQWSGSEAN
jgi:catechol 2,3-dioxygenase-like lactoylglutathione lyase family enzyme